MAAQSEFGIQVLGSLPKAAYKWRSSVVGLHGDRIFGIPWNDASVLEIIPTVHKQKDESTGNQSIVKVSTEINHLGHMSVSKEKWESGILSYSGRIYCIPCRADGICVIDAPANEARVIGGGQLNVGSDKYRAGCLAENGTIFALPSGAEDILAIDTFMDTVRSIPIPKRSKSFFGRRSSVTGDHKFFACAVVENCVVGVPCDSADFVIINVVTEEVTTVTDKEIGTDKFRSCFVHKDCVFAIPWNGSSISVLNVRTKSISTLGQGLIPSGHAKWISVVKGDDEKYYGVPFSASSVLVIDPSAMRVRLLGGVPQGVGKWSGGGKLTDGTICCVPYNSNEVLAIDPGQKRVHVFGKGIIPPQNNLWTGSTVVDGVLFGVPVNGTSVVAIYSKAPYREQAMGPPPVAQAPPAEETEPEEASAPLPPPNTPPVNVNHLYGVITKLRQRAETAEAEVERLKEIIRALQSPASNQQGSL